VGIMDVEMWIHVLYSFTVIGVLLTLETLYEGANGMKPLVTENVTIFCK
jgi:hypothetical protein